MADELKSPAETKPDKRTQAIQEYHDAKTRADKGAVVKKYPFLADIFSSANHDH